MFDVDGTKLKEVRVNANLDQKAVAEKVGASEKCISHYEKGRVRPSSRTLLNYLIAFNLNPKDIAKKV